jgi:uncharacterized protein YndB with AHSA1/START domain
MDRDTISHVIEINAQPDEVWRALTDPDQTRRYWYGALNRSTWQPGARWTSESADGELYLDGEILAVDAPRHMAHTMHVAHQPRAAAEPPSRVTIEIAPRGEGSVLVLTHDRLGPATREYVTGGWEHILGGLKTVLETGQPALATM